MSNSNDAASNDTVEHWSTAKVWAVLGVAWAVILAAAVCVAIGADLAAGQLFEESTHRNRDLFQSAATLTLFSIVWFGVIVLAGGFAGSVKDGVEHGAVNITPKPLLVVVFGLVMIVTLAYLYSSEGNPVLWPTMLFLGLLGGSDVLNTRLGPLIARRAPPVWAAALESRKAGLRQIHKIGYLMAAVVVLMPIAIIVALIARALFGD